MNNLDNKAHSEKYKFSASLDNITHTKIVEIDFCRNISEERKEEVIRDKYEEWVLCDLVFGSWKLEKSEQNLEIGGQLKWT